MGDRKIVCDSAIGELNMGELVVMSGVRPAGRTVDMELGRNCHGILFLQQGEARFWEKGELTAVVNEGELLYIPKGHKYRMQYTQDDSVYVLLNFELFDRGGEDLALFPGITVLCRADATHRAADIMSRLERDSTDQGVVAQLRRKELAYRLLGMIYSENMTLLTAGQGDSRILPGVLLLKQTYLENTPVERFAQVCSISISLFRELFKRQYGVSPVQYRNRLRIDRARQLLRDGGCTVAEAAYASGFENLGYFCNYYKKVTGQRPGQAGKDPKPPKPAGA